MESEQIIEKLKTFTTSELCDGFGNGRYRTMDYHIKHQVTNKNIVGSALPCRYSLRNQRYHSKCNS